MANEEQVKRLKEGVQVWNAWHSKHSEEEVDLSGADFSFANLMGANLADCNLERINLNSAKLFQANLSGSYLKDANFAKANIRYIDLSYADLSKADLTGVNAEGANFIRTEAQQANFSNSNFVNANFELAELIKTNFSHSELANANFRKANLTRATLKEVDLSEANCFETNLTKANLKDSYLTFTNLTLANLEESNLTGVNLNGAILLQTKIHNTKISQANVYGVSVWGLQGEFSEQNDLIITPKDEAPITVDNIKVAQFVYLILNNAQIRDVINTLTSKTVLILGRFALPERKAVLDALRNKLREYGLVPIVFDFERSPDKDFTETVITLASISYFVIADVTAPKSTPLELQAIVPNFQTPIVPIIQLGEEPFAMMQNLQTKYDWVLEPLSYSNAEELIDVLKIGIIDPAINRHNELRLKKARVPTIVSAKDLLKKS